MAVCVRADRHEAARGDSCHGGPVEEDIVADHGCRAADSFGDDGRPRGDPLDLSRARGFQPSNKVSDNPACLEIVGRAGIGDSEFSQNGPAVSGARLKPNRLRVSRSCQKVFSAADIARRDKKNGRYVQVPQDRQRKSCRYPATRRRKSHGTRGVGSADARGMSETRRRLSGEKCFFRKRMFAANVAGVTTMPASENESAPGGKTRWYMSTKARLRRARAAYTQSTPE